MEPQRAGWIAAGRPGPVEGVAGVCARCGQRSEVHRGGVRPDSAGFDGWHAPGRDALCGPCLWGRTTPQLRRDAWVITTAPTIEQMDRQGLEHRLRSPVGADTAVAVVLRPGRKHAIGCTRWGQVAVEDAVVPWGPEQVALYDLVVMLRGQGFSAQQLMRPSPDYRILTSLPAARWQHVTWAWQQLRAWREPATPWMTLALHATTTTRRTP